MYVKVKVVGTKESFDGTNNVPNNVLPKNIVTGNTIDINTGKPILNAMQQIINHKEGSTEVQTTSKDAFPKIKFFDSNI